MSERIVLFNVDGEEVHMYSPRVAQEMVDAGELFETPPLVIEESPPAKRTTRTKRAASKE